MPLIPYEELPQPRKRDPGPLCTLCRKPDCLGGCFYSEGRIKVLLAALPYDTQQVNDPKNYGKSSKIQGNRMEGQWAVRADLARALKHVAESAEDGALVERIVRLAYIGRPTKFPPGKYAGLSDQEIAGEFRMGLRTVGRYRERGLRLMVACLNPEYEWPKEGE